MTIIYGISNCDTVRKAKRWLDEQQIDYQYHDFRKQGLEKELLDSWVDQLGWEVLLNRRGTTWRKLAKTDTEDLDQNRAIALMLENPSLIKRPVLDHTGRISVGFSEPQYQDCLLR